MDTISWDEFARVELRVGTVVSAEVLENARNPAYILHIDCGAELGTSSPAHKSPTSTSPMT